ncbi:hypothetical protein H9Q09_12070 [Aurantimonas sp. DM33-3]|uniref:hypothetical protein n=1 Tax=Aurantimonas sp. DM33-3 TaxID=2766955 RepID=UPI0016525B63|nr:hypothetical protein [Aurantimonas sp. DM33-3]MBC6716945.1 hypothetical protein [Aurantimonas sp. DM33-3]
MPRYATGTMEAGVGDLYDVADHADDAAAVAAFEAEMSASHPDSRLVKVGLEDVAVVDFVARVADDFPLDATTISVVDIGRWVAVYSLVTDDDDDQEAA